MKNILKILSIFLLGLTVVLTSSCERENYPFPEAERVTLLNLVMTEGPAVLREATPPTTQLTFSLGLVEHGTVGATERVELAVVRNNAQVATLATITNQFNPVNPQTVTLTVQEVLNATGGAALEEGETLVFFYRVFMPSGVTFKGWTPETGLAPSRTAIWGIIGASPIVERAVVCEVDFSDLLGYWTIFSAGLGATWVAVATEDPNNLGTGLIFTVSEEANNGEPAWDHTVRMVFDWETFRWSFPATPGLPGPARQVFWDAFGIQTNFGFGAGAGVFNTCVTNNAFVINWTGALGVNAGTFGSFAITFSKIDASQLPPPPPPPVLDFSVEVEGTGLFIVGISGTYFAEADVVLGEDVDSAFIVVVSGDIQAGDIQGLKDGIANGTIASIKITASSANVEVPFPGTTTPAPGTFSFFVITFGDDEVQEYGYYTFVFPTPTPPPPAPDPDPTP